MYIYTDDDLTRINRDYLGPKGRRLPWVASYRTYFVALTVLVMLAGVYLLVGIPLNQWTALLYVFVAALLVNYVVRRLTRDVSLWAMFKAGWQEVNVPRPPSDKATTKLITAKVARFDYNAEPEPRWWQKLAATLTGKGRRPKRDKTERKRPTTPQQSDARRRNP